MSARKDAFPKWIVALLLLMGLQIAGVSCLAQSGEGTPSVETLTLSQALETALRHNRLISISHLQFEAANQRVAQTRIDLLPQFNVQAKGGELLDTVSAHFPKGFLGTANGAPVPSHDINLSTPHRFSTIYNLTLAQPLTQIPRIRTGLRLQEVGKDMAQEQERRQRQTIIADVRQVYFAILQTQAGVKATNANLKALQELERSVADSVVQQTALRADLLEVQAQASAQEAALSTLLDTLQEFKEQMNVLLGRDVRTPFQEAPEAEPPPLAADVDRLQAQALRDRPDLHRYALQVRQAELDRRSTRLGYLPDLSLAMDYSVLGSGINGLPDHLWTLGFVFSWKEPFDWGRRRHEIAEKTKVIEQAQLAYQEAQATTRVEVSNQIRKERQARDQLRAAQAAQAAARERLKVVRDQYEAKEALLKDVLQAQAALAEADRQVQSAGLAALIAQSELNKALGSE